MRKIIILQGLPASGKSTLARQLVNDSAGRMKRINKDDLRTMSGGSNNESLIIKIRNNLIDLMLSEDYDIVIDDTNLNPIHEKYIRAAFSSRATIETIFVDTPLLVCLERNKTRPNSVPESVIHDMYNRYIVTKKYIYDSTKSINYNSFQVYSPNLSYPSAAIIDIDGTLALNISRDIYDLSKVEEDRIIAPTKDLVNYLHKDLKIIIMSGRYDSCKEQTIRWLNANGVKYDELFMRPVGDNRNDAVIKYDLFNKFVAPNYNVKFVVDDRKSVKRMWNKIGLFVFDVNQHDRWF